MRHCMTPTWEECMHEESKEFSAGINEILIHRSRLEWLGSAALQRKDNFEV